MILKFTIRCVQRKILAQFDLCNRVQWSKECQMLFNADKCRVMHTGYNNKLAQYHVIDVKLECVSEKKRFGSYY